jgi:hypothetical protein
MIKMGTIVFSDMFFNLGLVQNINIMVFWVLKRLDEWGMNSSLQNCLDQSVEFLRTVIFRAQLAYVA